MKTKWDYIDELREKVSTLEHKVETLECIINGVPAKRMGPTHRLFPAIPGLHSLVHLLMQHFDLVYQAPTEVAEQLVKRQDH